VDSVAHQVTAAVTSASVKRGVMCFWLQFVPGFDGKQDRVPACPIVGVGKPGEQGAVITTRARPQTLIRRRSAKSSKKR
jgi:hypothetical protein